MLVTFKKLKWKIKMIGQMDGLGNDRTYGIPSRYPR
jgi:hypothetical protein